MLQVRERAGWWSPTRSRRRREASIVDGVVEAQFPRRGAPALGGRGCAEMAEIFRMTGRLEPAAMAEQTAAALA